MTNGEQMTAGQDSTYERDVAMRRRVLGDAHVAERVLTEMGVE